MFNIQEIEEREYFPQTEQQNVYQQSQMEAARRPNGKAAIKAMTDQGKWVLAYWMARLCPHTDALLGGADYSVAHVFDERNDAVKKLISQVIAVARTKGRKIGICGQAPSDYPDFAAYLVECGIDSISLNPDSVLKTTVSVLRKERDMMMIPSPVGRSSAGMLASGGGQPAE